MSAQPATPGVRFFVHGQPVPQGSKQVIKGNVVDIDKARLRTWRQDVAGNAKAAMSELPWQGPVMVALSFYLQRPKAHYGTGRNAEKLKPQAPAYPSTIPDIDKLVRAVLDALTGICFHDDRQVVSLAAGKFYGDLGMDCWVVPTVGRADDIEQ